MSKIIPTIMPKDFADLVAKYELVSPFVDEVQIDVSDGIFVEKETWRNPSDLLSSVFITMPFELHLMIDKPERTIEKWLATGAERILVHFEATNDLRTIMNLAKVTGTEIGLVLNIDTPIASAEKWYPELYTVQLMGIRKVGFQGQPFEEKVIERITELHRVAPHVTIAIDGGVSLLTVRALSLAGAERLLVGSAIFSSENPAKSYNELKAKIS